MTGLGSIVAGYQKTLEVKTPKVPKVREGALLRQPESVVVGRLLVCGEHGLSAQQMSPVRNSRRGRDAHWARSGPRLIQSVAGAASLVVQRWDRALENQDVG